MPVTFIAASRSTSPSPARHWVPAPIARRHGASSFDRLIPLADVPSNIVSAAEAGVDLHTLRPEPLAALAQQVRAMRHHFAQQGRDVRFVLPFRPVMAKAEERTLPFLARIRGQRRKAAVRIGEDAIDLIGTPEQVARGVLDHYDVGIDYFAIQGDDPLQDELNRFVRRKIAHRDALLNILAG